MENQDQLACKTQKDSIRLQELLVLWKSPETRNQLDLRVPQNLFRYKQRPPHDVQQFVKRFV